MQQKRNIWAGEGIVYFIAIFSILTILITVGQKISLTHLNFALHLNVFAFISFASALVDIVSAAFVIVKKRYNPTINWFMLFLLGATLLAVAEGFQRSSVYPQAALFWQNLAFVGLALLPPAFYQFIITYTNSSKGKMELLSAISIFTWGIMTFLAGTGVLYLTGHKNIQHTPWGYSSTISKPYLSASGWLDIFYLIGSGLLFSYRKRTRNNIIKKQVGLFIIAFLLPFLVALLTNVILPSALKRPVLPLATAFGAISAILVLRGIFKYRLFELDPQIIAQNILDTMSEGVIIVRPDKTIESLNSQAARLLGVNIHSDEHIPLLPYFPEADWDVIAKNLSGGNETKAQFINKSSVRNVNASVTPVRIAITPLFENRQKMATILVLSDISEIVKSYDALQKSATQIYEQNEQLTILEKQLREEKANVEHTVEVRTKELVDAQARLKVADQLKTEFIMLTSHNLRTPLAIAEGYADIALDAEQDEKKKGYITGLKDGLARLSGLVETLITINSIEAGDQLKLEDVDFDDVLSPLIKETEDMAAAKNDKFVTTLHAGSTEVKADIARLQGALRSLLNNACKFTQDGKVELSTKRNGDKLIISIEDNGIGIEKDELDKLFTKFHKGTDTEVDDYDGQGIGLYLSKLIIEEHNGKITADSEIGKGSTFTVELPCH